MDTDLGRAARERGPVALAGRSGFAAGVRDGRVMARALAALFLAGGTLSLLSLTFPYHEDVDADRIRAVSVAAFPVGLALWTVGHRCSTWAFHVVLGAGTVVVSVAVALAANTPSGSVAPIFYVWVPLYACSFFSERATYAHVTFVAVAYGVALTFADFAASMSQWVLVVGTVGTTAFVVGGLVRRIRTLARTDPLTGLLNRRAFEEVLDDELARAARSGVPVAVAVLDLDDFKRVNDRLGHAEGDRLLVDAARAWSECIRPGDRLARWGGDEFALVLPDCDPAGASAIVDRLRAADPRVEFSAGVARWDGSEAAGRLVDRADDLLYGAKRDRPGP